MRLDLAQHNGDTILHQLFFKRLRFAGSGQGVPGIADHIRKLCQNKEREAKLEEQVKRQEPQIVVYNIPKTNKTDTAGKQNKAGIALWVMGILINKAE